MKGSRNKLWSLEPEICRLFKESTLTIEQIAEYIGGTPKHTWNTIAKNFSREERTKRKHNNYSRSRVGENNPSFGKYREDSFAWKTGRMSDGKGYNMVLRPDWYTSRKGYNYIYEHHYVYCLKNNLTQIPKGYCIHHKDGDTENNSIENLLLLSMSDHTKLHARLRRKCRDYPEKE